MYIKSRLYNKYISSLEFSLFPISLFLLALTGHSSGDPNAVHVFDLTGEGLGDQLVLFDCSHLGKVWSLHEDLVHRPAAATHVHHGYVCGGGEGGGQGCNETLLSSRLGLEIYCSSVETS